MHKSVYDVLYKTPKLTRKLAPEQEQLARAIVNSGNMRLDADTESNFTRLLVQQDRLDLTFTLREITTPALLLTSKEKLYALLSKRHQPEQAKRLTDEYIDYLKRELGKKHPVKTETELMMARALVLCNALPVIQLIHLEGAEIFISFGQSVGEVMDVARWETMGKNSGLQAIGSNENAVYVSCGGHPFLDKDEARHSGDGAPALARFMIIAAQETGHNGDMIRDETGRWIGRYSASGWQAAPSAISGPARKDDIATTEQLWSECRRLGLNRIAEWERHLEFYRRIKVKNLRRNWVWCKSKIGWQIFKLLVQKRSSVTLPKLQRAPYPCMQLQIFFADMLANLTPQADVYKRKNASEEEAIACIEATARVPQQVVKWGHHAITNCTPKLYHFYYNDIVPACSKAAQRMLQRSK